MLGGILPNMLSCPGMLVGGDWRPEGVVDMLSSKTDPAGPGVGARPSRIALAMSAAFHFA